jgi:hypothetical protein
MACGHAPIGPDSEGSCGSDQRGIAFSRDGNLMASCVADGTVRLWPAVTLEEMSALNRQ